MEYLFKRKEQKIVSGVGKAIFSYLIVFLVPFLIISSIWYVASVKSIQQQVELSAKNQLIQLKYSLENNFIQLNYLTQKISGDYLLSLNSMSHPYYAKEGKERLQAYKMTSEFVEEIYLHYNDREDTLYSSAGNYNIETFLGKVLENDMDHTQQLINQLNVDAPTLLTVSEEETNIRFSRFFYVVPMQNDDLPAYGSVIYEIKASSLKNMLDLTTSDGVSTNFVVNDHFQIVASTSKNSVSASFQNSDVLETALEKQIFIEENQKYFIQSLPNTDLGISVVSVTNMESALKSVNRVQNSFFITFIIMLILGIIVVVFIGRRSYRPIERIERLVRQYNAEIAESALSIEEVHTTLEDFFTKHQELHREIQLQTPHAREQVLRKLISDRFYSSHELALLLKAVHVQFQATDYFVMVLDAKTINEKERNQEASFLIDSIEQVVTTTYSSYATEILSSELIALVIGFTQKTTQEAVVEELVTRISKKCDVLPPIGIGNVVQDLTSMNVSYIEGLAALAYHSASKTPIVYYREITYEETNSTISYPEGKKLKLIQALNQGNRQVAMETVHMLISEISAKNCSTSVQKMYGFYLLNAIAQTGGQLVGQEILQKAEEMVDFIHLTQLETNLNSLIAMICEKVQAKPQEHETKMNETIISYTQKNFTSSQLCLETIAETFDVSVSYVSRFVKKETGMTFSKYIQMLRLNKIKEDLLETDLPIKEIIQENGYYDVSNYTRKFRTIVGVTPGQYRTLHQQTGNGSNKKTDVGENI
ncbi:helix-turn-helix domain-containing protein [Enterococcus sp. DIV0876]|uniref:helix-turn-helix domain-containing protein n=1 Tax=Enterococcus sp. DIV0876 TaxID=2774633 RepID=UPI003D2FA5C7